MSILEAKMSASRNVVRAGGQEHIRDLAVSCIRMGDIESAIQFIIDGGCWDLLEMVITEGLPAGFQLGLGFTPFRWCPPGRFLMGSPEDDRDAFEDEKPQHEVTFAEGFWMAQHPVTQEEYESVMGVNPSHFKEAQEGENVLLRPVECVSWEDAVQFCRKLTEREHASGRLPEDWEYRLPSEAEWEYACRAGTTGPRYGPLDDIAWYGGNSGFRTHQVELKMANPWGIHDMLGNVWEWCLDNWHPNYIGAPTDGSAWIDESE